MVTSEIQPDLDGERRRHPNLRAIFEAARTQVAGFLDAQAGWGGAPLQFLAYHHLRDAYPELTPDDAQVLLKALLRVHREQDKPQRLNPAANMR